MISVPPLRRGRRWTGSWRDLTDNAVELLHEIAEMGEPIVRVRIGPIPLWIVVDPDASREILTARSDDFDRPWMLRAETARMFGAPVIFSSIDERWQEKRHHITPEFHKRSVVTMEREIRRVTKVELDTWPERTEVDLQAMSRKLGFRIAGATMFSFDFETDERGRAITEHFNVVGEWLVDRLNSYGSPLPFPIPNKAYRTMRRSRAALLSLLGHIVAERRHSNLDEADFLQMLIDVRVGDEHRELTDKEIMAECFGMLFAANAPTSSTLAWTLLELGRNPAEQERLRSLVSVEGVDSQALGHAIDETLRLHPPGWALPRSARRATKFRGYWIPPQTWVLLATHAMNRDERLFDDPDIWRPERHANPKDETFLPLTFGMGPRQCVGIAYSTTVLKHVLAAILARYEVRAVSDELPDFRADFASLRVPEGMPAVLATVD